MFNPENLTEKQRCAILRSLWASDLLLPTVSPDSRGVSPPSHSDEFMKAPSTRKGSSFRASTPLTRRVSQWHLPRLNYPRVDLGEIGLGKVSGYRFKP